MWWHLKSPASQLCTQPLIHMQIEENIKALCHWPLCWEFTSDQCNSPHKGLLMWKMFPFDDVIVHKLTWDFSRFHQPVGKQCLLCLILFGICNCQKNCDENLSNFSNYRLPSDGLAPIYASIYPDKVTKKFRSPIYICETAIVKCLFYRTKYTWRIFHWLQIYNFMF